MLTISRSSFSDKPWNYLLSIFMVALPRDLGHGLHNSSTILVSVDVIPFVCSSPEHAIN